MRTNRATNLLRLATKGQPFSALVYFIEEDQKYGALITKGSTETEYQASGTYEDFVSALESVGVKLKPKTTFVQLIGTVANKFLQNSALETV